MSPSCHHPSKGDPAAKTVSFIMPNPFSSVCFIASVEQISQINNDFELS